MKIAAPQLGSFRVPQRSYCQIQNQAVTFSQRRSSVKPLNAQPKRNDSIVPLAATVVAPGKDWIICLKFLFGD